MQLVVVVAVVDRGLRGSGAAVVRPWRHEWPAGRCVVAEHRRRVVGGASLLYARRICCRRSFFQSALALEGRGVKEALHYIGGRLVRLWPAAHVLLRRIRQVLVAFTFRVLEKQFPLHFNFI